jgi:hypothetical protein
VKKVTTNVRTTGIIDSNKGLFDDLNVKMKNETTKGINHIKKPKKIIVRQFRLSIYSYS